MRKRITCRILSLIMILSCIMMLPVSAFAVEGKQQITGTLYEFDEDINYVLSEATKQSQPLPQIHMGRSVYQEILQKKPPAVWHLRSRSIRAI